MGLVELLGGDEHRCAQARVDCLKQGDLGWLAVLEQHEAMPVQKHAEHGGEATDSIPAHQRERRLHMRIVPNRGQIA